MNCEVCDLKNGHAMIVRVGDSSPEIIQIPEKETRIFPKICWRIYSDNEFYV